MRVGEAVWGAFWDLGRGGVGGAALEDSAEVAGCHLKGVRRGKEGEQAGGQWGRGFQLIH